MGISLPCEFTEKMQALLGGQYEAFLASYDQPRQFGLRVNTQKLSAEAFEKLAPFHLKKIPWIKNGYYYEEQDAPASHPFYYAGLYYLQEPSAMTPASVLPVHPGERVLDLCAAPGGKATELGAKLCGKGVLVANDISASRAKALLKNIEVFGISNAFVTSETPARLERQFGEFFDKILVDAPCSGEGMFRKDPAVLRAWDADKPQLCAKQQKEIIARAANMLRPGGLLLYSTCTFSPEENEQVIAYLLESRSDMELMEIPGYEGFSPGLRRALAGYSDEKDSKKAEGTPAEIEKCVRIFPHKMAGEGHFLALLRKRENGALEARNAKRPDAAGRSCRTEHRPALKKAQQTERDVLEAFLSGCAAPFARERLEIRKGQAYYVPEFDAPQGLQFLRNGLYLGEIKKERFEPSQSFAMALRADQYAHVVDLPYTDERVKKYLKGETIEVDDVAAGAEKGWQLVCVNGYPLGWGKLAGGTLKNKYHSGWRMKC